MGDTKRKIARLANWALALTGLFIVVASILGINLTVNFRDERRSLAPSPKLTWISLWMGRYFGELDRYINDHFFSRLAFIALKTDLDWRLFHKGRRDLVMGKDGFVFYRFIAESYQENFIANFPYERWETALKKLKKIADEEGKKVVLQSFRNKEYLYQDKLPWAWSKSHSVSPFLRVRSMAKNLGISVFDYTDDFRAARAKGTMVYSPFEENHCSPEAFFIVMDKMLTKLGNLAGMLITPPKDFPKVVSNQILPGNYRTVHYVNTNYPHPPPWLRTAVVPGWSGVFEYENKQGKLPATIVYSDSFMEVFTREFGAGFLPYFKRFTLHWSDSQLAGWGPAKIVMISFSDQAVGTGLSLVEDTLANLEKRKTPSPNALD